MRTFVVEDIDELVEASLLLKKIPCGGLGSFNKKNVALNQRQKKVLNKLLGDFEGKLTREKWMKLTKASSRTALRDINELIELGLLEQEEAGGRSTSYRLKKNPS